MKLHIQLLKQKIKAQVKLLSIEKRKDLKKLILLSMEARSDLVISGEKAMN
jgi:hypothetical protein